jgi:NAD(P)-dependent dehydrogenase (short-subunit alcohol dehydrogenase family)
MQILVTGRSKERGDDAVAAVRRAAGHDAVGLVVADALSVRENIRLADEVARRVPRLDILVNNVGGGSFAERQETPEGLEATLALNFAGPFALTTRLLARLEGRLPARIINVVSSAYAMWTREPSLGSPGPEHTSGGLAKKVAVRIGHERPSQHLHAGRQRGLSIAHRR